MVGQGQAHAARAGGDLAKSFKSLRDDNSSRLQILQHWAGHMDTASRRLDQ